MMSARRVGQYMRHLRGRRHLGEAQAGQVRGQPHDQGLRRVAGHDHQAVATGQATTAQRPSDPVGVGQQFGERHPGQRRGIAVRGEGGEQVLDVPGGNATSKTNSVTLLLV